MTTIDIQPAAYRYKIVHVTTSDAVLRPLCVTAAEVQPTQDTHHVLPRLLFERFKGMRCKDCEEWLHA